MPLAVALPATPARPSSSRSPFPRSSRTASGARACRHLPFAARSTGVPAHGHRKIAAFYESWNAMVVEMARANMRLLGSPLWWSNPWKAMVPGSRAASMHARTALDILHRGTSPYHRRAVANARRLTRGR
jgi:hypothetical protein